ncbi:hypothetical protein ST201phi2-1p255 [Pseudomonas phage 201phi2-1]|uniref:Uncharacterized protein n=1 Tax=Pseudomonas phage 201phi2-1 TaxID=198110 RepID=B3FJB7_BP201|nr:hypothetical protein ST201phi2-1p255 [Pseudomonas phage 201phi2-1]ABY63083.1 hypothetical protein 201phi2-1p255 [Pseudomonas phage 201phi2-1]
MEPINNLFVDPEQPDVDYAELDFDDQLKHTQRLKGRLLHKLTAGPEGLPTDKDGVELLLKVADSMDKVTIAKRRLVVDEKKGDDALSILNAIAQSVQQSGGAHPFLKREPSEPTQSQDLGELPEAFEKGHAKGEGDQGVIIEASDKFISRMDVVNKEQLEQRSREMGLLDDLPQK